MQHPTEIQDFCFHGRIELKYPCPKNSEHASKVEIQDRQVVVMAVI